MRASKLAHLAADQIFLRGWWRRSPGIGPGGQLCLVAALTAAEVILNQETADLYREVYNMVAELVGMGPQVWNDHHAYSKEVVIAMLHKAGFILAQREEAALLEAALPVATVVDVLLDHVPGESVSA